MLASVEAVKSVKHEPSEVEEIRPVQFASPVGVLGFSVYLKLLESGPEGFYVPHRAGLRGCHSMHTFFRTMDDFAREEMAQRYDTHRIFVRAAHLTIVPLRGKVERLKIRLADKGAYLQLKADLREYKSGKIYVDVDVAHYEDAIKDL
ncbi:hypothetical protein LTR85_012254 [Meristemomyces frigidus]|nr:hypothetical protein LTR85_012254 [Meristemomyces frigidus]